MASLDWRLLHWLYAGPSGRGAWLWTMVALTVVGSGWSLFAIVPFVWPERTRRLTLRLLAALVATAVVVFALKAIVGRVRPCDRADGVHALVFAAPTDPSFPSGHAAGAFAFAALLAMELMRRPERRSPRHWLLAAALLLLACGIALSRVALGVHFPSDVTAGAAIGGLIGVAASRRARRTETEAETETETEAEAETETKGTGRTGTGTGMVAETETEAETKE